MALVRDGGLDPFSGALHVFRSKRADPGLDWKKIRPAKVGRPLSTG
ncbi:hypothetical protein [Mesorhizobium captivum]